MANIPILSFNAGEASPQIDARTDVSKYQSLCRHLENFIPRIYGGVERRPGTYYIASSFVTANKTRVIPFVYSSEITYDLEFGDFYIRAFYNDEIITTISSPYLSSDIFQIQHAQIGDTMWLVHPDYAQRKLTRTSATTFSLDIIAFNKGPFMLRNDLVNVDVTETSYMLYEPDASNGTDVGDTGTLTCQDEDGNAIQFFNAGHAPSDANVTTADGALFKLTHNRWNKVSKGKLTGTNTGILCKAIDVKGDFRWTTHGTWTALVELQKNENETGWTTVESYEGQNDINVPTATKVEENDNVQYRVNVSDEEGKRVSSTINSSITVLNDTVEGIVRVTAISDDGTSASVEVVSKMESMTITGITKAIYGVVTCTDHSLNAGDEILISQVSGMTEINGLQTVKKILSKDTFELNVATLSYTTYTSGGIITPPPTRRWAEGFWSYYRGFPSAITFLDDRCIYGGSAGIARCMLDVPDYYYGNPMQTGILRDDFADFYGAYWKAQSFTVSRDFYIKSVRLFLKRVFYFPGDIIVSIRATSDYKPTGSDLTYGVTDGDTLPLISIGSEEIGEWREIVFNKPYLLSAGSVYAIVVRAPSGAADKKAAWGVDAGHVEGDDTYPIYVWGYASESSTSGVSWAKSGTGEGWDCLFEIVGAPAPKEQRLWFSETGDYENFEEGEKDADSFSLVIPTTNEIRWIKSLDVLFVGTCGDEWKIGANKLETPLTPTNFTCRQQSNYGCRNIQPSEINEQLLFVDFVGRKVRELTFSEDVQKFVSPDLTALSEHITESGITCIAHQRNPDSILWATLDDGSLISMTYEREQDVVAWSKHPIDGTVLSVCVTPGESEDKIFLSVERGLDVTYDEESVEYEGDEVVSYNTYIEKMMPRNFGSDLSDAFFVDCGITTEVSLYITTETVYYEGSPVYWDNNLITVYCENTEFSESGLAEISGLEHLAGETVTVLGDGVKYTPTDVVSETGTVRISVTSALSKIQVGLPYTSKLEPLKPVASTQMGTSAASITSVREMGISLLNSVGVECGAEDGSYKEIDLDDKRWVNLSEIDGLFTGTVAVSIDGGYSLEQPLIVSSDSPLPLTVRALIPRMEQTGR